MRAVTFGLIILGFSNFYDFLNCFVTISLKYHVNTTRTVGLQSHTLFAALILTNSTHLTSS